MTKQDLIDWAITVDKILVTLRIIPRSLLITAWTFYIFYVVWVTVWYMERVEIAGATANFPDSVFAGGTIVGLGGILKSFQELYQKTRGYTHEDMKNGL